jgi:hypothetical protein
LSLSSERGGGSDPESASPLLPMSSPGGARPPSGARVTFFEWLPWDWHELVLWFFRGVYFLMGFILEYKVERALSTSECSSLKSP